MVTYKDNGKYRFDHIRRRWVLNDVEQGSQSQQIVGSVVKGEHVEGSGVMVCPNALFSPGSSLTLHGDNSCSGMHIKGSALVSDVHIENLIVEDDSSLSNVHGNASVIASGATINDFEVDGPLSLHVGSQSILEGNEVVFHGGDSIGRSGFFVGDDISVVDNTLVMGSGGVVSIHSHEGLGRRKDYDKAIFHNNTIGVSELAEFKANGSPVVKNCTITIGEGSMLEIEGVSMQDVECNIPSDVQLRIRNWDREFGGHITGIECVDGHAVVRDSSGGLHHVPMDTIEN